MVVQGQKRAMPTISRAGICLLEIAPEFEPVSQLGSCGTREGRSPAGYGPSPTRGAGSDSCPPPPPS